MTKKILDDNEKVITVWFDAWRYEREENLAVIPFLRTIKLTLDASHKSREGRWEGGVKRSAAAFLSSTKVTYGIKDIASAEILVAVDYSVLIFFASMFVVTFALWSSGAISTMMSHTSLLQMLIILFKAIR